MADLTDCVFYDTVDVGNGDEGVCLCDQADGNCDETCFCTIDKDA